MYMCGCIGTAVSVRNKCEGTTPALAEFAPYHLGETTQNTENTQCGGWETREEVYCPPFTCVFRISPANLGVTSKAETMPCREALQHMVEIKGSADNFNILDDCSPHSVCQ